MSETAATPPPGEYRVLVVDDDPDMVAYLEMLLRKQGMQVETASGGREAIAHVAARSPDLVLCDVMMPDIGGMDVYESVRRARPELESRFAFVTGGAFTRRARGFLASVDLPCLDKPLDLAALEALVLRAPSRVKR